MVVTFQLPENVRYWDEDNLLDDYYLEYTDKSGKKQTFTMAEAKAAGWGIELTQRYFAGAVAPAENTADGLTRQILPQSVAVKRWYSRSPRRKMTASTAQMTTPMWQAVIRRAISMAR